MLVVADHAATGGEDGRAHRLDLVDGHEPDELEPLDRRGLQGLHPLQPEHDAGELGQPAAGFVQVGMRRDDSDSRADRAGDGRAGIAVVQDAVERREDKRMVCEDALTAATTGLFERRRRHVQRDENAFDIGLRGAHLQADVVPRLGKLEGDQAIELGEQCPRLHCPILAPGLRAARRNVAASRWAGVRAPTARPGGIARWRAFARPPAGGHSGLPSNV